jgi:hypothetical protein
MATAARCTSTGRSRRRKAQLHNLRERLELSGEEWTQLDASAQRVADESVAFAKAGTDPQPIDALEYVYSAEA